MSAIFRHGTTVDLEPVFQETGVFQFGKHLRKLEIDRTSVDSLNNEGREMNLAFYNRLVKEQLVVVQEVRRIMHSTDESDKKRDHFVASKYYPLKLDVPSIKHALAIRRANGIYSIYPDGKIYN